MRIGSRLLILAVALVLLGACAEANRVVSSKSTAQQSSGATLYTVGWRSDLYAPQAVAHSTRERDGFVRNCYDRATVGEPLPFDCLTRDALFNETGAFSRNPLSTLVFSLLAIGGLLIFAMRRIGAVPQTATAVSVAATGTGATTRVGQRAPLDPTVRLMQNTTARKDAYAEEWTAHQRLGRPGQGRRYLALGSLVGLLLTVGFGFLVGFVAGGEWGLVTALVIYLGVAAVYVFSLTSLLTTGTHREAVSQRLAFFGGVATGLLAGGLVGSLLIAPLFEFDGVRWLF